MKILVGAGSDAPVWSTNGWTCNDTEDGAKLYSGITMIGPCWSLAVEDNSVDEIMARGMIEHMTYHEVARSFREWHRVLKPGGYFTGEVPDVVEYIRIYFDLVAHPETSGGAGHDAGAEGEPDDREVCIGPERWLRRALWGWQRWPGDEHRSGWTEPLFDYYIKKYFSEKREIRRMAYSFDDDIPDARIRHLWGRGWKV